MIRKIFFIALTIFYLSGSILTIDAVHAKELCVNNSLNKFQNQVKDEQVNVQDGPYVFWIGHHAIVQYVCNNQKITHHFEVTDSINIASSCEDTSITYKISADPPSPESDTFVGATKIFAISDIHGNFEQLIKLLKGNKIIDNNLHWNWGNGHLVIIGDVFDRGEKVTEALWFIYQLEKQARKDGGQVHFVLGNHEIMVLRGDLRYVNKKYTTITSRKLKIKVQDLYGPETELGRWLRSKNVIIKINNILFVHAGISPVLPKRNYTIEKVNQIIRKSIDVRDYAIRFNEELELLYGSEGPLWYRGYIMDRDDIPMATEEQVISILAFYHAEAVVVGHTIIDTLTSYFGGHVFAIETGIHEGAEGEALIWENGKFYRSNVHGQREFLK